MEEARRRRENRVLNRVDRAALEAAKQARKEAQQKKRRERNLIRIEQFGMTRAEKINDNRRRRALAANPQNPNMDNNNDDASDLDYAEQLEMNIEEFCEQIFEGNRELENESFV